MNQIDNGKMTRAERTELAQLIRKRERVLKTAADERATTMLKEFEEQMAAFYSYDDDQVWKAAYQEAEKVLAAAQQQVARRSKELGIPEAFAPELVMGWRNAGSQAVKSERARLRTLAKAQVAARTAEAKTKIERYSLDALTQIITNGIESEAARAFLEQMPPIEHLMPALEIQEVKKLINA